jgi:rod shape determining protein RodA
MMVGQQIPWLRMNWLLIIGITGLVIVGLFFIYSAGYQHPSLSGLYRKQMMWATAGLLVFLVASAIDYRRLEPLAPYAYAGTIGLLIAVLFVGKSVYGAKRWLDVGFDLQPAELAKLSTVLMLSALLSRPDRDLNTNPVRFVAFGIAALPFLLIAIQPDLGTAMVLIPLSFLILFVAGMPLRIFLFVGLIAAASIPIIWQLLAEYQQNRVLVFLDPGRDPQGAGWNPMQSRIAVGSGGLYGKGFLEGTQNQLGYLPRKVAPTDFIFSVIGEELGFAGALLVIVLYALVLLAIAQTALLASDRFGRLVACGVMALIFSHAFVNVSMTVGLMPVTGLPLPLISYGGSFMISTLLALGIVQSIHMRRIRT